MAKKKHSKEEYICPDCGYVGHGAIRLRGSAVVERFIWYVLLLPGPLYSYWRRSGKDVACDKCGGQHLVALDSKLGALMLDNQMRGKNPPGKNLPR